MSDGSSSRLASPQRRRDAIGELAQEFAQGGCFAAAPGADGHLKPTKEQEGSKGRTQRIIHGRGERQALTRQSRSLIRSPWYAAEYH